MSMTPTPPPRDADSVMVPLLALVAEWRAKAHALTGVSAAAADYTQCADQLEALATPPAPDALRLAREAARYEMRGRNGINRPWGEWEESDRETFDHYTRKPSSQWEVRALHAVESGAAVQGEAVSATGCDWTAENIARGFVVQDMQGEHDPCYVYMPDGAGLAFNHHAINGVDQARAEFVAAACNAMLDTLPPGAAVQGEAVEGDGTHPNQMGAWS